MSFWPAELTVDVMSKHCDALVGTVLSVLGNYEINDSQLVVLDLRNFALTVASQRGWCHARF